MAKPVKNKTDNSLAKQRINNKSDGEKDKLVEVSKREIRLRERLESIDEEIVRDENRAKRRGEEKRQRLQRKIAKSRKRQNDILNRREKSKIYSKAHWAYYLLSPFFAIGRFFRMVWRKLQKKAEHHKQVTPHRSFYVTTRGKAIRKIKIAGYFRFQREVWQLIWDNKKLFGKFILLFFVIILVIFGVGSQSTYTDMRDTLNETDMSNWIRIPSLVAQAATRGISLSDTSMQLLMAFVIIMAWLTIVYLLRKVYSGYQTKLRDGLYNGGAPILSVIALLFCMIFQLLPFSLAVFAYNSMTNVGVINNGIAIENMAAWLVMFLLLVLTVYWMVASILALITVTIPGIYPMKAYFETSRLVSGRRMKILLRMVTMLLPMVLVWLLVLLIVIPIDNWINLSSYSLIPPFVMMLVMASIVWVSTYMYMLYRRILDSPLQPIGKRTKKGIAWPWLKHRRNTTN